MRICFYSPHAYQLFNPAVESAYGGAEVQLWRLATALARRGIEVRFIVGDYGQPAREVRQGVQLIRTAPVGQARVSARQQVVGVWRSLRQAASDVYVARAASAEVGILAAFSRLYRRKFVYMTAHEMDCTGEFVKRNGLAGQSFAWGLQKADVVLTQHAEHQQLLAKHMNVMAHVLPSGMPVESTTTARGEHVLWVARCDAWKHPELFVRLAERLPQYEFLMVCPAQRHRPELYVSLLEQAVNVRNVTFVPKVLFENIQHYFQEAKLFVNTSQYEGFPNTFLQAGAAATPIVSWRVNPNDMLTTHGAGLWADGDFEAVVAGVQRLLDDAEVWKQASQASLTYVREHHDIEKVADDFWQAVTKVAT